MIKCLKKRYCNKYAHAETALNLSIKTQLKTYLSQTYTPNSLQPLPTLTNKELINHYHNTSHDKELRALLSQFFYDQEKQEDRNYFLDVNTVVKVERYFREEPISKYKNIYRHRPIVEKVLVTEVKETKYFREATIDQLLTDFISKIVPHIGTSKFTEDRLKSYINNLLLSMYISTNKEKDKRNIRSVSKFTEDRLKSYVNDLQRLTKKKINEI